jgi:hypothetical protein
MDRTSLRLYHMHDILYDQMDEKFVVWCIIDWVLWCKNVREYKVGIDHNVHIVYWVKYTEGPGPPSSWWSMRGGVRPGCRVGYCKETRETLATHLRYHIGKMVIYTGRPAVLLSRGITREKLNQWLLQIQLRFYKGGAWESALWYSHVSTNGEDH